MSTPLRVALVLIAGLGVFAPAVVHAEHVFARVGEVSITTADIEAELVRAHITSPSSAELRGIAYSLLEHQLLLRAARVRSLNQHSDVVHATRSQTIQHLMRTEFDEPLPRSSISEQDITAHYASHPQRYARGLEASSESIRGQLWRERRDTAVEAFVSDLTERVGVLIAHEANLRMSRVVFADAPTSVVEQVQRNYECPHCARINAAEEGGSTAWGTPLPSLPAWTRRAPPP